MSVRIAIVGTGYVGLVTGACLAELGHDVVCIDNDKQKIEALNNGHIPIYEPGLDELVSRNVQRGTLRYSLDLPASVRGRDAVFIAVGTPSHPGTDQADLRYVVAATEQVASSIDRFTVIVIKSTVPVGTNRLVQSIVERCLPEGQSAAVASNPEFLREGSAIGDFLHPDRIVFGAENEQAMAILQRIYAPLEQQGYEVLATEIETAEVIKYAANAFLAVKISYINEIADLCEAVGADVDHVATGIGLDHRIGAAFLKAGPGWGGSCFPKDTRALKATASEYVVPMRIVDAAIEANARRKDVVLKKIEVACGGSVAGKRLAIFGLTFKGQTDDVRESPSIDLVRALVERGARIHAYDPSQPAEAARLLPHICMCATPVHAIKNADALVILTDWKSFIDCDLRELSDYMSDPVMVDMRNLFDEQAVRGNGFRHYVRVGRGAEKPCRPQQVLGRAAVSNESPVPTSHVNDHSLAPVVAIADTGTRSADAVASCDEAEGVDATGDAASVSYPTVTASLDGSKSNVINFRLD
ncbi:UDP-glucose/GDP-mannose dehydrogenase family protein [Crenobacter sp. SG2305]|uniref:UDP-glucose dehydrogenase family protein n=1 Tax=Crenobacter oryzisoli TaxID=3056844 RepID=UPI0025AA54B4|nr:UDP-glucose/GDP-mannose dehydrogenase family protein [Crenobacter sp. SG2305]MDN0084889.1 UDP-glucose/GDP-mannose dehydrogenase family protein [Crenobacter sp. SG2305]